MTVIEKSFCTTSEAADMLGVSVGTVQQWAECGLLNAWKTAGGHRRVMRDSVELLLRRTPGAMIAGPSRGHEQVVRKYRRRNSELPKRRLNVMVLVDDPQQLRDYEVQMSSWHFQPVVTSTSSAFSALMMLGRWAPDMLAIGLEMPGIDACAMLKALANAPEAARTKIVAIRDSATNTLWQERDPIPTAIEVLSKDIALERMHDIASRLTQELDSLTSMAPMHR